MCSCFNRCMLIAVNVVFLIVGAGLTGVAIWVIVSQHTMFDFLQLLTKDVPKDTATLNNYMNSTSTLLVAAYVAVVFGGLSVIIGFCGCCGALKKVQCLLIFYAVAVSIILLAEIAGGVVAIVFKQQIGDQLKPRLTTLEKEHFLPLNLTLQNKTADAAISTSINYLQVTFQCCGVTNVTDITGSDTLWYRSKREYNGMTQVMPITCCKMKSTRGDLVAKQDWSNVGNYLEDPSCPNTGNSFNDMGCYNKIDELINTYSLPIIIICIVVAVFEIMCVIMACCMVHQIRKSGGHNV